MEKPALVVVCGAPASGKTILARRLAEDLALPLLEKDTIKESLADLQEILDREASKKLGVASMNLLYDLASRVLTHGSSVMIEANFDRRFAEDALRRMASSSQVLIVHCEADATIIEDRYRGRSASGERHPVHFDLDALPDLTIGLQRGAYNLTNLGYPSIRVRTDDGYEPHYNSIVSTLKFYIESHRKESPGRSFTA